MKVVTLKDSLLAEIKISPENINWSEEYYERLVSEVVNLILAKNGPDPKLPNSISC